MHIKASALYRWLCKRHLLALAVVIAALLAPSESVAQPETVKPLEAALGPGWRCALLPDGLQAPGSVYRVTKDKRIFPVRSFAADFKPQSGPAAVGTITSTHNYGFELLAALTGLKSVLAGATVQANADRTYSFEVSIPSATKESTFDEDPGRLTVRRWFAALDREPDSAYFLVRETISARSVTYRLKSDFGGAVNADASARKYLRGKVGAQGDLANGFELKQVFDNPLRLCLSPEQLIIRSGRLDGKLNVDDVLLKKDPTYFEFTAVSE